MLAGPPDCLLLLAEGHAISTLVNGGVALVSTHQNAVQGAEILLTAVVCALLNSALNALVCVTAHVRFLLFL